MQCGLPLKATPEGRDQLGRPLDDMAESAGRADQAIVVSRIHRPHDHDAHTRRQEQEQEQDAAAGQPSRSSIDMHTAQEGVASTTRHHSAIMNLTLGGAAAAAAAAGTLLAAARCTVADRAINAPACVVQPYCLFIHWPSFLV